MAIRLSIIVPTPDGDGLDRLFDSLLPQLTNGDEVIVVGDTHDGPLPLVEETCRALGPHFRYVEHDARGHAWGHPQINQGMQQARGDYLVFIDDDDVFTPEALHIIRTAAGELREPRVLMFRFECQRLGRTLPEAHEVIESAIGGHCIVPPNIPDRLGQWGDRYGGDFDFIVSTLAHWPDGPVWCDDVIAIAR